MRIAWLDDFLYLPEVLYVMILVWLIFSGPGRYSIDGLAARRRNPDFEIADYERGTARTSIRARR